MSVLSMNTMTTVSFSFTVTSIVTIIAVHQSINYSINLFWVVGNLAGKFDVEAARAI